VRPHNRLTSHHLISTQVRARAVNRLTELQAAGQLEEPTGASVPAHLRKLNPQVRRGVYTVCMYPQADIDLQPPLFSFPVTSVSTLVKE
jgi:hypothetical protein